MPRGQSVPVWVGPGASDTGDATADRVLVVLGATRAVLLFHGTCAIHGILDVEGAGRRAPTRQPGWWRVGSPCDVAYAANASLSDFVDMYGQPCPARCDRSGKGQPALRRCGRCVGCPGRGSPLAVRHPVEDLLGEIVIYTLGSRYCLPGVLPHAFECRLRVLVAGDGARGGRPGNRQPETPHSCHRTRAGMFLQTTETCAYARRAPRNAPASVSSPAPSFSTTTRCPRGARSVRSWCACSQHSPGYHPGSRALFYAASTRPFLRSASTRTARVSMIFIRRGARQRA